MKKNLSIIFLTLFSLIISSTFHFAFATENMIWTANGLPRTNLGNNGDFYLDKSTGTYYLKYNGSWILSSYSDARGVIQQTPKILKAKSGTINPSSQSNTNPGLQINSQAGILAPSFTLGSRGYFYCSTGIVNSQGLCVNSQENTLQKFFLSSNSTNQSKLTNAPIMGNATSDCKTIASRLGGKTLPSNVCDVLVIRKTPHITNVNGLDLSKFIFMNNLIEFLAVPETQQVHVVGFFALLETEKSDVLSVMKNNGWSVADLHDHQSNQIPKVTFLHWETQGDINKLLDQINEAFSKTTIK